MLFLEEESEKTLKIILRYCTKKKLGVGTPTRRNEFNQLKTWDKLPFSERMFQVELLGWRPRPWLRKVIKICNSIGKNTDRFRHRNFLFLTFSQ